ncbi:hypothetical protein AAY473_001423 [Plecturocebus cupreus]
MQRVTADAFSGLMAATGTLHSGLPVSPRPVVVTVWPCVPEEATGVEPTAANVVLSSVPTELRFHHVALAGLELLTSAQYKGCFWALKPEALRVEVSDSWKGYTRHTKTAPRRKVE